MTKSSNRTPLLQQALRLIGVGTTVAAGFVLYRQQAVQGFLLAFLGLSIIALAETAIDMRQRLTRHSLGGWLRNRSYISTLGQLCNIASFFCLAAAIISWIALR